MTDPTNRPPNRILALLLLLVGCDEGPGPCPQRVGTYATAYTERSGNCGPIAESVVTVSAQPTSVAPCSSGQIVYSADNCEVTSVAIVCPADGGTITFDGKMGWDADGEFGSGVSNIVARDDAGVVVCEGTYDVVAYRL